jgi:hypothetical protein
MLISQNQITSPPLDLIAAPTLAAQTATTPALPVRRLVAYLGWVKVVCFFLLSVRSIGRRHCQTLFGFWRFPPAGLLLTLHRPRQKNAHLFPFIVLLLSHNYYSSGGGHANTATTFKRVLGIYFGKSLLLPTFFSFWRFTTMANKRPVHSSLAPGVCGVHGHFVVLPSGTAICHSRKYICHLEKYVYEA